MKALFGLCIMLMTSAYCGWLKSPDDQVPARATIKVLLKKHSDGALIEAKGAYEVVNPEDEKHLSSGWKGKRYYAYPHTSGIKWGEDFPDIYQFRIIPKSPETTFLVDGIQYKGCIEVYHIDSKLHIVNEVDVENYLKSTLTSAFLNSHVKDEVMDALSIVSRTHAYYTILRSEDAFWHVDSSQVQYTGAGLILQNLNIDRSVDATRDLIMAYEGRPFAAGWTQNCAGKTASYRDIYRKYISCPSGIKTPFAAKDRSENKWTCKIAKERLAHLAKTNRVTGIELFVDEPSGKVYGIQVQDGKHHSNIDYFALKEALGSKQIQSNDFKVTVQDDSIIFEGFGEGPGIGLCLHSASQMADKGDLAPEILATFFPYTHIQQQRSLPGRRGMYEEHHTVSTEATD